MARCEARCEAAGSPPPIRAVGARGRSGCKVGVAAAGRFSRLTSLRAAFDAVFAGCFDGGAFAGALGLNMGRLSDHMREVHPAGSDRFGARRVHGLRTLAYTELPKSSNAWHSETVRYNHTVHFGFGGPR